MDYSEAKNSNMVSTQEVHNKNSEEIGNRTKSSRRINRADVSLPYTRCTRENGSSVMDKENESAKGNIPDTPSGGWVQSMTYKMVWT